MRTSLLFLADFAVVTTKPFANVFDRAADNTLRTNHFMRLLQKEVLENRKGETTQSFRYAQRRKRGRRKRYVREAHYTLRRFRRFAPRSLKAIGFLQQSLHLLLS